MTIRKLLETSEPVIMGILNVTPDSFSDGGKFLNANIALKHALQMEEDGADIIDIGGESSRPGSDPVSVEDEIERVIPVIKAIREKSKVPISIDTTKSEVAKLAIDSGANMINDISAGRFDDRIFKVAAKEKVPICLMHMKGTPKNMQNDPHYDDLIGEIRDFFLEVSEKAKKQGVGDIILDPGIGFGKAPDDNITILKRLSELKVEKYPILLGTSRKSFIGTKLHLDIKNRLEPTLASLYSGYINGARWFRVHDTAPARRFLDAVRMLEGE